MPRPYPTPKPITLSGQQLARSVRAAKGLWTLCGIAKACCVNIRTPYRWREKDDTFPAPAADTEGVALYAGTDVLDWLNDTSRFASHRLFETATSNKPQHTQDDEDQDDHDQDLDPSH